MPDYPPFMNSYGLVPKILDKIKTAQTPSRFTLDFLATKLGFSGGSARPFVPLAKRIGLVQSDGTPSELYKAFRNPSQSKAAMGQMVRKGYSELYSRNEYAHDLPKDKLEGLVIEITGLNKGNPTVRAICNTFQALVQLSSFDTSQTAPEKPDDDETSESPPNGGGLPPGKNGLGLNLAYTINLVLPKTDDVAVFNAIFRSLRENLLK